MAGAGGGGGGGGGGIGESEYLGFTDCARDVGSTMNSTVEGRSFAAVMTDGSTECCVGVRGDESTTDEGDVSEFVGDAARCGTEVTSDCTVASEAGLSLTLIVDDLFVDGRACRGLDVFARGGARLGEGARTVLGCEPVVDVSSVLS